MDARDVLPAVLLWISFPIAGAFALAGLSKVAHVLDRIHKKVTQ